MASGQRGQCAKSLQQGREGGGRGKGGESVKELEDSPGAIALVARGSQDFSVPFGNVHFLLPDTHSLLWSPGTAQLWVSSPFLIMPARLTSSIVPHNLGR